MQFFSRGFSAWFRLVSISRALPAFIICVANYGQLLAQPHFDAFGLQGWSINSSNNKNHNREDYASVFFAAPIKLNEWNTCIVAPAYELRKLTNNADSSVSLSGASLPLTFLHYSRDSSWAFTATALGRMNTIQGSFSRSGAQLAGALTAGKLLKKNLRIKFGLYYSGESFGAFFLPLAGIDWRINDRWYLYGLLPSNMRLQYQIGKTAHAGCSFKSMTNSFSLEGKKGYCKLKDNHLFLFGDIRIAPRLVVVAEAGQTFFRKIYDRTNAAGFTSENNGLVFKAGLFYRVSIGQ